jgi:hypothetical protein
VLLGRYLGRLLLFLLPSATNASHHGQIGVLTANSKKQDQSNNLSYVNLDFLPFYHLSSYEPAYLDSTVQ